MNHSYKIAAIVVVMLFGLLVSVLVGCYSGQNDVQKDKEQLVSPPTPTATATSTITPTPIQVPPTATPTATPRPATILSLFCQCRKTVKAGEMINLRTGWMATSKILIQDFLGSVKMTIKIDGGAITGDLKRYWYAAVEIKSPDASGKDQQAYVSWWIYPLKESKFLKPGLHRAELSLEFSKDLADGMIDRTTGKQFHYLAGEVYAGWVEWEIKP